jgi:hypothetical protein
LDSSSAGAIQGFNNVRKAAGSSVPEVRRRRRNQQDRLWERMRRASP